MATWTHAIVTGAGSGLGHGLAERLLQRGVNVSALDLRIDDAPRAALDVAAVRGGARWARYTVDVTSLDGVRTAVDKAVALHGRPELAVHFAGVAASTAFAEMEDAEFYRVMNVNVYGSYHFARAVLPHLRPGARLALTSSMAGITSNYGYTSYATSKFAVLGLATTLRIEYEPLGIHVSCICPPEVRTPMVAEEHATGSKIGLEVKQLAGSLAPDEACDAIVAELEAGKWLVVPGYKAKGTAFIARHMPGVAYAITSRVIRRVMRKHGLAVR